MHPLIKLKACLKKTACLMMALVLILSVVPAALAAQAYPYETKTAQSVNMRRQPNDSSVVLERLSEGDTVIIMGETGDYYEIAFNGRTGYAMKKYVTGDTADTATTAAPAPTAQANASVSSYPYETTTNAKVNMRKSANTSSALVKRLEAGETIIVEGVSGDFLKVSQNGDSGYVMAAYVNVKLVAVSPVPDSGYTTLQKGDLNDNVYALQLALLEMKYLSGKADGNFGSGTESAVKAFQANNALPQTGAVDPNMQALIYEGKPKHKGGQKVALNALSPLSGAIIRLNAMGKAVEKAAQRLKDLGYYADSVGETYTQAMQSAAKEFQKKNGLNADGAIGSATSDVLYSASAIAKGSTATPAPTPAPTVYQLPSGTVKAGSQGDDARLVQQRLKDLGYLTAAVDGKFGSASVAALKAFQTTNKIEVDGACGKATSAVLFSDAAIAAQPLVTASPTPSVTLMPVITKDNYVLVTVGVTGEAVLNLQKRLTALGYYSARNDGQYLSDDMAAVQAFQAKNNLSVDGKAGYETQLLLYSDKAVGPEGINTTFDTLRQGHAGTQVVQLQQKLIDLKYLTGTADGKYGAMTAQAVANFQRANNLVRDGIAGAKTLTLLYATTAAPAATASPTPPPASVTAGDTVRQGDTNDAVKAMQQRLIDLGYLTGKADGAFGSKTLAALIAFQTKNGLSTDGVAGKNTWNILNSASAKPANASSTGNSTGSSSGAPKASQVTYANWYTTVRSKARSYPYATIYDYVSGQSWQVHMFSLGAHADAEPLTAQDTANMLKAFGGKNTWNPKAVWVIFGDGTVYMASTHSYPHEVRHIKDNNFPGHLCIHFPRTQAQVEAIGPYATSHQTAIDKGWEATQRMK